MAIPDLAATAARALVPGLGRPAPRRAAKAFPGDAASERPSRLQVVKPFIAAVAVVLTGGMLVLAIYFTLLDLQWIAFLAGVLFAAILTMASKAARAELAAASRAENLVLVRYQLAGETAQRAKLEQMLVAARLRLQHADEALPVMIAFVDDSTVYRYHNRSFADWLGLPSASIDGQHMRDVLGLRAFADVDAYVAEVASGRAVRFERSQRLHDGRFYRLAVQYLPQFGKGGKYAGFYKVISDITDDSAGAGASPGAVAASVAAPASAPALGHARSTAGDEAISGESIAALDAAWREASQRILAAINGNEFALFCQHITPLESDAAGGGSSPEHYEVLIRLLEEERSMMPPGAFFALAEEHGLLPQLDRWVFTHVFDWMRTPVGAATVRAGAIYFVNVAADTIRDPDFPEFVAFQLRRTGVPAASVCIEIAEPDLNQHQGDAVVFAQAMRRCGLLIAVSGFGHNPRTADTLKLFAVDFLKIDGGIVRQIVAYPAYLAKAVTLSKLAKSLGVGTIAEMVEDEATVAMLRKLGINFVQGFGISHPQLLTALSATLTEDAPPEEALAD